MTNAGCGKPGVLGQPWEEGAGLPVQHLGLDPTGAQGDYCHGPNSVSMAYTLVLTYICPTPWDRVSSRPGMRASPSHASTSQSLSGTRSGPARGRLRKGSRHGPTFKVFAIWLAERAHAYWKELGEDLG